MWLRFSLHFLLVVRQSASSFLFFIELPDPVVFLHLFFFSSSSILFFVTISPFRPLLNVMWEMSFS